MIWSSIKERHSRIPKRTVLEVDPPAKFVSQLALREGNHKKPIYEVHKWWARRLGSVFRTLLIAGTTPAEQSLSFHKNDFFYEPQNFQGLVVLDPFVGGGTSVVEAAKCNANVVGIDIDPVACFVTAKELASFDSTALLSAFQSLEEQVKDRILRWYRTTLPNGQKGTVIYAFWVDELTCPKCKLAFEGHPHYQLSRDQRNKKQTVFCAKCGEIKAISLVHRKFTCSACRNVTNVTEGPVQKGNFTCPGCQYESQVRKLIHRKPLPHKLFALEVLSELGERIFKKAEKSDLELFQAAKKAWRKQKRLHKYIPSETIPVKGRNDARPLIYGYKRYQELFNARQLLSLSILVEAISKIKDIASKELLGLAFSDCLASNNMFCSYAFDYQKLTPLFSIHAYTKISRPVENNVWGADLGRGSFIKCFNKLLRGKNYGREPFEYSYEKDPARPLKVYTGETVQMSVLVGDFPRNLRGNQRATILNQSSESLKPISSKSVDFILTDPPYYNNLAYSELSDFYHVWLKRLRLPNYLARNVRKTPMDKTLFVRQDQKRATKDHQNFVHGLSRVFVECNRVLKDEGLLVFTFHHNSPKAWIALANAIVDGRFYVSNVFPVRSEGQSRFHSSAGNIKWDAVFCCRKLISKDSYTSLTNGYKDTKQQVLALAKNHAAYWTRRLERAGLTLNAVDIASFNRASIVQEISKYCSLVNTSERQSFINHLFEF